VEIEFAVRLSRSTGEASNFGFLQVRPLVLAGSGEHLHIENVDDSKLICKSTSVLGNGRIQNLRDLVVVDFERFERVRSHAVAEAVAHFNAKLMDQERPYLLVGVGRWGSNDPWLGIPIEWDEIAGARVIVEAGLRDMTVTPSQGSHFFQNLMAFQVGYFTVNPQAAQGMLDWEWLAAQEAVDEEECVRHIRLEHPAVVVMNGMTREWVIFKPGMDAAQ